MEFPRSSGILLHPTSLPGRFGMGDLGDNSFRFVDFLAAAGQQLWQILPLGPTGYGDSPYQCFSAFAGNPLLISLDKLVEQGFLPGEAVANLPTFPATHVDFGPVIQAKNALLNQAIAGFKERATPDQRRDFEGFSEANKAWLDDYALFMALKDSHGGATWSSWELDLVQRQPEALQKAREDLAGQIEGYKFLQWVFFNQWYWVKTYANSKGIKIIGDIPIFVAYDSADVWSNPELFFLDEKGQPTVVAGVPPDYFSATGQLWGNPLYRWDTLARNGYDWWIRRLRMILNQVDIVRLDHFRGFEDYWAVPATDSNAINGRWMKGPSAAFFETLQNVLGDLPIIAEDLGQISRRVMRLRDTFQLPGMKILHFAFGAGSSNPYLPHNFERNTIVYTGSHDNDTTVGWFSQLSEQEQAEIFKYIGFDSGDIAYDFIRLAFRSVANVAVVPLQDYLRLGTEARMNYPGRASGNWGWRFEENALTPELAGQIYEVTELYGRTYKPAEPENPDEDAMVDMAVKKK
ncbi:MAG: 4-alpha-glucanotransferase [Chloroflexi bacterium]|nr:4-alpha-glucanotransferase [Chloroflexota bacterium]OJV89453.1 MAG: 4-alpha-glucanotransferase [Chloroflexi bacterium 54-19]